MDNINIYKNKSSKNNLFNHRIKILFSFSILLIFTLLVRLYYIQVIEHEKHSEKAKNNILKTTKISPKRGEFYDRNGVVIANNRPAFDIVVIPEQIDGYYHDRDDSVDKFLKSLNKLINLSNEETKNIKKDILKSPSFSEVLIQSDIDIRNLSNIASNIKYLEELGIRAKEIRNYPYNNAYLSVLGYVSKISHEDRKHLPEKYIYSDYIGKSGLEKIMDNELYGTPGHENIAINAQGRVIDRIKINSPEDGKDYSLTIDNALQNTAIDLMGIHRGTIIAVNPNNGEILTLISTPSYDANKFIKGISHKNYNTFFKKNSPLFNRAIMGQYSPASIIKPFIAFSAIHNDIVDPEEKVWSGPHYQPKGMKKKFRDWKRYGHGWVNMSKAIEVSSDVYFYKLAEELGITKISETLEMFNYGEKWNINLLGEKKGIRPSVEWKQKRYGEQWYGGETINMGIGQGYITATPLQMLMSTTMLINGGKGFKPKLTLDEKTEIIKEIKIDNKKIKPILDGYRNVMVGEKGTAKNASLLSEYSMGGKTGTAQVISTNGKEIKDNEELPMELRDHALFVGFAPFENPEIAVIVVVEHGSSGSETAAPIAVKLMDKYLKQNNKRIENWV